MANKNDYADIISFGKSFLLLEDPVQDGVTAGYLRPSRAHAMRLMPPVSNVPRAAARHGATFPLLIGAA